MRTTAVAVMLALTGLLVPVHTANAARVITVSPQGSDASGQGSDAAPYATIAKALQVAGDGDTIQLKSGTYREGELIAPRSVKIVEAPGATAVLDGSEVIDAWKANGDGTWSTQRTDLVRFCDVCTTNSSPEAEGMARFPEQVFVDGAPLRQVASRSELKPGTFWVNDPDPITSMHQSKPRRGVSYVLGSDPAGHRVEIVQKLRAITITGSGLVWDGVDVRRYNAHQEWGYVDPEVGKLTGGGAFVVAAQGVQVKNATFSYVSSASAVALDSAAKAVVSHNTFTDNGAVGLNADRSHDLTMEGNTFSMNNRSGFITTDCGAFCTLADVKITHTLRPRYLGNRHDYSKSPAQHSNPDVTSPDRLIGVWLDEGVIGATIARNHFVNVGREAIFSEVSSGAVIASNLVERSYLGIMVSGSDHDKVYNNTVVDTAIPLEVREDTRFAGCNERVNGKCTSEERWSIEHKLTWDVSHTEVFNNVLMRSATSKSGLATIRGHVNGDGRHIFANEMVTGMDRNVYLRTDQNGAPVRWNYARGAWLEPGKLAELTGANVKLAVDRHGQDVVAARSQQSLFQKLDPRDNGADNDLRARPGGALKGKGVALPQDVAAAIGVPAGQTVDAGALANVAWSAPAQQGAQTAPAPQQAPASTAAPAPTGTTAPQQAPTGTTAPAPEKSQPTSSAPAQPKAEPRAEQKEATVAPSTPKASNPSGFSDGFWQRLLEAIRSWFR
ncbi:MAG: right-handed parallel beta-helix repeat-containing protein [Actinomycetia bacterium]|nr:right-handed parallel beta-helix repeat-containing protein [Actinomycetes bacterium]